MKIKKLKLIIFLGLLLLPQVLLAQGQGPEYPNLIGADPSSSNLTLEIVAVYVLNIILGLLGLLAVIIVILSGFKYMLSGGDSDKAKTAMRILKYSLTGLVLIIFSALIVNYIFSVLYQ